jgi:hypothetical protein
VLRVLRIAGVVGEERVVEVLVAADERPARHYDYGKEGPTTWRHAVRPRDLRRSLPRRRRGTGSESSRFSRCSRYRPARQDGVRTARAVVKRASRVRNHRRSNDFADQFRREGGTSESAGRSLPASGNAPQRDGCCPRSLVKAARARSEGSKTCRFLARPLSPLVTSDRAFGKPCGLAQGFRAAELPRVRLLHRSSHSTFQSHRSPGREREETHATRAHLSDADSGERSRR